MEWNYLREILLNRHRDSGFGADWSKREAASVGGLFHFKRNVFGAAVADGVREMTLGRAMALKPYDRALRTRT